MPELPEVETTLRGIKSHILHQPICELIIRHHGLRWPIPRNLPHLVKNQPILHVKRRGKYLLIITPMGTLILHLGMSGSLRICTQHTPVGLHDHVDFVFPEKKILRLNDPRRFGALLWTTDNPLQHSLLAKLGPEPLTKAFSTDYLEQCAKTRKAPIKSFIMNNHIVVGVGNIYATEALFNAGIHPEKPANRVDRRHLNKLVLAIKKVLAAAIKQGGTTLRNFVDSDGKPGYFKMHLNAYGRAGLPCVKCKTTLKEIRIGQRSTVFCSHCQR